MRTMQNLLTIALVLLCSSQVFASKNLKTFTIKHQINAPIDKVWAVLGKDFGKVANSHHGFVSSSYQEGQTGYGEGAIRICYLNDKKSRYVVEKQVDLDDRNFTFVAEVIDGKGLPLATGTNRATYTLKALDNHTCELIIQVAMRSKPAIFSMIFSGKYKDWMEKFAIGLHHHVITDEIITAKKIKEIEKKYK